MKKFRIAAFAFLAALTCAFGCAGLRGRSREGSAAVARDANVILEVFEVVNGPNEDVPSCIEVFVDGEPAGKTNVGPKSIPKSWGQKIAAGNHLFRFEKWDLPQSGDWRPADSQWQPPERFFRVEEGSRLRVALRFFDLGRGHSYEMTREPLPR